MSRPDDEERAAPRRSVLRWLVRAFLSLWGLGAAGVAISFLKAPESGEKATESLVKCGPFSSLPVGSARFIRHGTDPLFVVRASETEVVALSAICTHLRCVLQWDEEAKIIRCPCHAGSFDRSGNVLSGLPPRSLRTHPAELRADEIVVRVS